MWSQFEHVIKGSIRHCKYEINSISLYENIHERMTNVGAGDMLHTVSLVRCKNEARDETPLKLNNFANIGTIDLI